MAKAFVAACAQYFGRKEGQTLSEFQKECNQLTPKDKAELAPLLAKAIGEDVMIPPPAQT